MKNDTKSRFGGFTLIELLVVVLIIGILAAVAVPQYQKAVHKARLVEAFTLGKHFKDAEEVYFMSNGEYTDSFEELGVDFPNGFYIDAIGDLKAPKAFRYSLLNTVDRVLVDYYPQKGVDTILSLSFYLNSEGNRRLCCGYTQEGKDLCKSFGVVGAGQDMCSGGCLCWDLP